MNILKRFVINSLSASYLIPAKIRADILRTMGIKTRTNAIRAKCFFNSEFIRIGKDSSVNYFCQFHSAYVPSVYIDIGEKCFIGMNVTFCTITHEIGEEKKRAGENLYFPIKVGDGCWIGANSTILPNVTIGSGCIIGAGSVVISDCENNCLYAGNPAKKIKELK